MQASTIGSFNAFLMITLIVLWGSSFVVVEIALRDGLTPVAIATFRFLVAGGFFLVMLLFKKCREQDCRLLVGKEDVRTLLFLALTGVTFFFTAQYTGIQMASAPVAAIFVCLLSPILITILSAHIFKERFEKKQIVGIGLAIAGASTVLTRGALGFPGSMEFFLGSLILLSTPVLWATYSLLGKKIMEKYSPFLVVAYVAILGGLCLIPFSLAENSLHLIFTMSLKGWMAVLFLSLACSLFGYYIWFYVLKQVGAAVTSSFLFAEPLVTVLFSVTFIGEKLNWSILVGGLLVFIGVYLVTTR
ncbi:MAG: EamA family transporter [Candidatus Bathyarchaeota archaeon]|nr:MAG: EamA family transporter [Candidatus Bathyarchaeota archaeon]